LEVSFLLVDYHVHPAYSADAIGTVEEYCLSALELGVSEIGFTPHFDIHPWEENTALVNGREVPMTSDWLSIYQQEVRSARELFEPKGLKLRIGVEIGYTPEVETAIRENLSQYDFDFIIGSVHILDGLIVTETHDSTQYFADKSPAQVCEAYFTSVEAAVNSGLFDIIGHLDIYKRYGLSKLGPELVGTCLDSIMSVLNLIAAAGVGLEVNASGYRHGTGEPYPGLEILKLAREAGLEILTVSTDSHRIYQYAENVENLKKSIALAKAASFTEFATFTERKVKLVRL